MCFESEPTPLEIVIKESINVGESLEELQRRVKAVYDKEAQDRVAWEIGNGTA